ncbi:MULTISPECIES: hypothetical protein [unclassified Pseudodesulfovibrio]|uniref:Imm32 family immunity protein n=1 Tax=unclassified Pseudodesulfovibrio TaxID=2661612 RepID=UPI000FEB72E0|nr:MULTISPECIES: hypothetical protein [unclassified Pseudodesulfovibrio]MCJ2166333.1 hypothetical protein [Pseudodesulfovibrio sp. S3-i]
MKYSFDLPDGNYWKNGVEVEVHINASNEVVLKANSAGFLSLARLFLLFSMDDTLKGEHMHLDELTGLEDGSCELIIERS